MSSAKSYWLVYVKIIMMSLNYLSLMEMISKLSLQLVRLEVTSLWTAVLLWAYMQMLQTTFNVCPVQTRFKFGNLTSGVLDL